VAIATGDALLADRFAGAPRALAAGRAPSTACSAAFVRAPIYAPIVREKLSWIGAPSQALLQATGDRRRVNAFLHAPRSVPGRAPAIDDVIDRDEDRACAAPTFRARCSCSAGRWCGRTEARAAGRCESRRRRLHLVRDLARRFAGAISSWRLAGDCPSATSSTRSHRR
jgi:hypothetical protein